MEMVWCSCEGLAILFNKNKTYKASVYIQGDEVGADAEIYLYVIADGKKYVSGMVELDGWQDWKKLTIDNIRCKKGNVKIGIYVDHACSRRLGND